MWPVWPERKQEGGDDITQENVMMNDDGDDCGDVDGDKCWSKVTYPQFDVFSPSGGLLHSWRLGNSQNRNVPPYHRTTVPYLVSLVPTCRMLTVPNT